MRHMCRRPRHGQHVVVIVILPDDEAYIYNTPAVEHEQEATEESSVGSPSARPVWLCIMACKVCCCYGQSRYSIIGLDLCDSCFEGGGRRFGR